METFGDRLKSEREDQGLSIPAVAETLGVDQHVLTALERNDFDTLPAEAVMMDCLDAYADCLDVDAELMIADYLKEREKGRGELETGVPVPAAEPAAAAGATPIRRRPRFEPWAVSLAAVTVTALAAWWFFSQDEIARRPETPAVSATVEPSQPAPSRPLSPATPTPLEPPARATVTPPQAPVDVDPTPVPSPAAQPRTERPMRRPAPAALEITEYGVGTAVENRILVGRSDSFPSGTRVCFWTHVRGAANGPTIDHVWLHEGVETSRITLKIGGPNWRTYSAKTLPADWAGNWAVEARDDSGRVLARSEFVSR